MPSLLKVSVVMPVERIGGDAQRAVESVLRQSTPFPFELIVVSAAPLDLPPDERLRNVLEPNRNPATRRNRAVSVARGEILAFIDDDAQASPGWLATAVGYLDDHPGVTAVGGPDPAPEDSSVAELIADTLLAAPFIGSGIACHQDRRGVFPIEAATDVALVNLFVRRGLFTGFDEAVGYIGEDTVLIGQLMQRGPVVYHDGVRVAHRRRAFPGPYLRQRWRYRVKTGELLAGGSRVHRSSRRIQLFMVAGTLAIVLFPLVLIPYVLLTLILGVSATRLPPRLWPLLPAAFAMHHATYYFGILWGAARGLVRRSRGGVTSGG